jgi:endonuclease III
LAEEAAEFFPKGMTVLDHLLFGVVQEEAAPSLALAAYKNLISSFHNFNEIRVSQPAELAAALEGVPDALTKGKRIVDVLQFVFETTYGFDLESMKKKPIKQAQKQLSKIPGTTKFAVAAVVLRTLSGSGMPLDERTRATFRKLGMLAAETNVEEAAAALEAAFPAEAGVAVATFVAELADDPKRLKKVIEALAVAGPEKTAKAPRASKKSS